MPILWPARALLAGTLPPPPTSYTVIFDANGGTGTMSPETASTPTALTANDFTYSGYTFNDWNTEADGSGISYANETTFSFSVNATLYAQWTVVGAPYTVTFNANGGTGSMASETENTPTALTSNTFTYSGYAFSDWNTEIGGGGTFYANGATYSFAASITLYAQWIEGPATTYLIGVLGASTGFTADTAAGFDLVEIDVPWSSIEPTEGSFSSYVADTLVPFIQQYKTAGYKIALGAGLGNNYPSWVYGLANGNMKDQSGAYSDTPNFVFCPAVRSAAQAYLNYLIPAIAAHVAVDYYRIGLGTAGECFLPAPSTANGSVDTSTYPGGLWWAFDALAQGSGAGLPSGIGANPMPGWYPGQSTWDSETVTVTMATTWWDWWIGAIINAHEWQVAAHGSAGWSGAFSITMPGDGAGPSLITTRLDALLGDVSADSYALLQTGACWHLQVPALADGAATVLDCSSVYDGSGSPANNASTSSDSSVSLADADPQVSGWSATRWLAYLAGKSGIEICGETVGGSPNWESSYVTGTMAQAYGCGLFAVFWANDTSMQAGGSNATPAEVVDGFNAAYGI